MARWVEAQRKEDKPSFYLQEQDEGSILAACDKMLR